MRRGYIAVEGDVHAVHNLIVRLWADLKLAPMFWAVPRQ